MSDSKAIQDASRNGWTSDRLVYRAIEDNEADLTFFCESIANDPSLRAVWNNQAFRPLSRTMASELFTSLLNTRLSIFICLPAKSASKAAEDSQIRVDSIEPEPIGFLTLRTQGPEQTQHRSALLAIAVINAYQDNGYGPEAINWALDWAFKFGGMHRVGLDCFSFNHRGLRVYERLGFVKEGVIRQALWFNGGWHDFIYYGMLEPEWEKLRAKAA